MSDAITIGSISVTYLVVNSRRQLVDVLPHLVDQLPPGDAPIGRIVLIVPDTVRALLGWPSDQAPRPMLTQHDLVFKRADSGLSIQ